MINLPDRFYKCMKETLRDDCEGFLTVLDEEPFRGLRVNTLKCSSEKLKSLLNFDMVKTPFCDEGYYISNKIEGLGNHPLHHAGAFYLQEPSAMSAVTVLSPQKGEKILDLCAAPGGKSTQIGAVLDSTGLLWANEIVGPRAKILLSNIERMGIKNAVVSSVKPDMLCERLSGFFDKVLVDAPCSGEGMLRREPNAAAEWKIENRAMCAERQAKILDSAALALKAGGILVYSTCTLSGEENEQTISSFLKRNQHFELIKIENSFGRPAYSYLAPDCENISYTRRILPKDGGEGHFVAALRKTDGDAGNAPNYNYMQREDKIFKKFYEENFNIKFENTVKIGDSIIILPEGLPELKSLNILRAGVLAGSVKAERFIPEHALYTAFGKESKLIENIDLEDKRIYKFLHGEEIDSNLGNGYCTVAVDNIPTGFGKISNGIIKNHYPKGLRILKY